jgi:hypothetical protein
MLLGSTQHRVISCSGANDLQDPAWYSGTFPMIIVCLPIETVFLLDALQLVMFVIGKRHSFSPMFG